MWTPSARRSVGSAAQRINSGQFDLTSNVGRPYLTFLGGLRPVLGAGFGLMFYFAVTKIPRRSPRRAPPSRQPK